MRALYNKLTLAPTGPRCPSTPFTDGRKHNVRNNGNQNHRKSVNVSPSRRDQTVGVKPPACDGPSRSSLTRNPGGPGPAATPCDPLAPCSPGSPASPWEPKQHVDVQELWSSYLPLCIDFCCCCCCCCTPNTG